MIIQVWVARIPMSSLCSPHRTMEMPHSPAEIDFVLFLWRWWLLTSVEAVHFQADSHDSPHAHGPTAAKYCHKRPFPVPLKPHVVTFKFVQLSLVRNRIYWREMTHTPKSCQRWGREEHCVWLSGHPRLAHQLGREREPLCVTSWPSSVSLRPSSLLD